MRMRRSHEDRMLDREDQISAGSQRSVDYVRKAPEILDIVKGQGAINEVESHLRQFQHLKIDDPIFNGRVRVIGLGARDHVLR